MMLQPRLRAFDADPPDQLSYGEAEASLPKARPDTDVRALRDGGTPATSWTRLILAVASVQITLNRGSKGQACLQ